MMQLVGLFGDQPLPANPLGLGPTPEMLAEGESVTEIESVDDLDDGDKAKLLDLVRQLEEATDTQYQAAVLEAWEGRNFGKLRQWDRWNSSNKSWVAPDQPDDNTEDDSENPDGTPPIVIDLYGSKLREFCALMSAASAALVYEPEDADNPDDRKTAELMKKVVARFERQNRLQEKQALTARFGFNDGYVALRVRHVKDKDKYGSHTIPQLEPLPVPVAPEQVDHNNVLQPAVMAETNKEVGEDEVIHGDEELEVMGVCEVRVSMTSKAQDDTPFLTFYEDVPIAKVRQMYGDAADGLMSGESTAGASGSGETIARQARIQSLQGVTSYGLASDTSGKGLVTVKHTWIRDWALNTFDNKADRTRFAAMFPDGAYFCSVNGKVLDASSYSMDDEWVLFPMNPSEGICGVSYGAALRGPNRELNTLRELQLQGSKFSAVPAALIDTSMMDPDAYADTRVRPGMFYPVKVPEGKSINGVVAWTPTPPPDASGANLAEAFWELSQPLTGIFNAAIGAPMEGNDTYHGLALAHAASMGVLGLPWRAIKTAFARLASVLLRQIQENREETDQITAIEATDDGWRNDPINVADLKGRVRIYADSSEDVPLTYDQKKSFVAALFADPDPAKKALVMAPENIELTKPYLSIPGLKFPGEGAWQEQSEEITTLLTSGPDQPPGAVDPQTGQPVQKSTVPVHPLDNHQMHVERIKAWKESDDGRRERRTNPAGFNNVCLHAMEHEMALQPPPPPQQPGAPAAGPQPPAQPQPPMGMAPGGPPVQ